MKVEKPLQLTEEQEILMDLHTVLNLFNILLGEMHLIQMDLHRPSLLQPVIERALCLKEVLIERDKEDFNTGLVRSLKTDLDTALGEAEAEQPELLSNEEYLEYKSTFEDVLEVFDTRMDEILTRWMVPDHWDTYTIPGFQEDLKTWLKAVEKNSRGRYRIIYDIAEQTPNDYLINFEVSSDREDELLIFPLLFKDVMRDLVANARKYTPRGGVINVSLQIKNNKLRFEVADNGIGIPEQEIEKVLEFGRRATNTQNKRTMGGGFGLTKAYSVTRKFAGDFWIDSEESEGTCITIEVPLPEELWED